MRLIDAHKLTDHLQMVQKRDGLWGAIDRVVMEVIDRFVREEPTVDAAPRWHSMEDNGPPEENGLYFVYAPSYRGGSSSGKESARGVMISKWTGKHWSIEVGYYKRPGCVTHWMPIEPPKEKGE